MEAAFWADAQTRGPEGTKILTSGRKTSLVDGDVGDGDDLETEMAEMAKTLRRNGDGDDLVERRWTSAETTPGSPRDLFQSTGTAWVRERFIRTAGNLLIPPKRLLLLGLNQ